MNTIVNKKLYHDFEVIDKYSAGIELLGHEVKSIRAGKINITGSRIIIGGGELFLVGADIHPYQENNVTASTKMRRIIYDKLRTRKLLMSKKEIGKLFKTLENKSLALYPLSIYDAHGIIKVDVALCKKLNKHDKREVIKSRDLNRKE